MNNSFVWGPWMRAIAKSAVGLSLFAMVTAGLIALTQNLTENRIELQRERAQAEALLQVIPQTHHDNRLLEDTFVVEPSPLLGLESPTTGYRARQGDKVTGVVLPVRATEGYSGPIRLVMGIGSDGTVLGVRILEHRETPGLGDQVELGKSDWVLGFNGASLTNPALSEWGVKKDGGEFDQFTGATITPRAVVAAVKSGLEYFRAHRMQLLGSQTRIPAAPPAGASGQPDLNQGRSYGE